MLDFGSLMLAREEHKMRLESLGKRQTVGNRLPGVRVRLLQRIGERLVELGARMKQRPLQRAGAA